MQFCKENQDFTCIFVSAFIKPHAEKPNRSVLKSNKILKVSAKICTKIKHGQTLTATV